MGSLPCSLSCWVSRKCWLPVMGSWQCMTSAGQSDFFLYFPPMHSTSPTKLPSAYKVPYKWGQVEVCTLVTERTLTLANWDSFGSQRTSGCYQCCAKSGEVPQSTQILEQGVLPVSDGTNRRSCNIENPEFLAILGLRIYRAIQPPSLVQTKLLALAQCCPKCAIKHVHTSATGAGPTQSAALTLLH